MSRYVRPAALLLGLAATALATTAARREAADEAAVRQTIQHYFDGGMTVRKAFHPSARMTFVADTGFTLVPIETYLSRVEEGARKNPNAKGWGSQKIASIDVTGDAAVAKLELENDRSAVTDYMTLLRIDGQWVIVNKSFTRKTKDVKQAAK
jgi:hypothetical protein